MTGAAAVPRPGRWRTLVGMAAGAVALGAVFLLYLQPEFAMTLANQVWACF